MKALRFNEKGDLAHLRLVDAAPPLPAAGEVLVRVKAAGLNKSDVSNVMGGHPYTTVPRTPGRDFAGVVERGPRELEGRAVWGTGKEIGFTRDGSHAEYLLLPAEAVSLKPERLSFEEAASCGVPYVTAWHALSGVPGEAKTLVIGAAGAVGVAAMHIARRKGLNPTGAVRNTAQADRLRAHGFDAVLLEEKLPGEWDAIFDTTGHWLVPAIGALARFGRVIVIVAPGDGKPAVPIRDLYRRGASIVGVNSLIYSAAECAHLFADLSDGFQRGELAPPDNIVARPLAPQTYVALQRGEKGKLVIVP